MDKVIKANTILKNHLKLYKIKKLRSTQEYLNPILLNNNKKSSTNK